MKQDYSIIKGRTEIEVSHKDSNITFIHPAHGPDTYSNAKQLIEKGPCPKSQ